MHSVPSHRMLNPAAMGNKIIRLKKAPRDFLSPLGAFLCPLASRDFQRVLEIHVFPSVSRSLVLLHGISAPKFPRLSSSLDGL